MRAGTRDFEQLSGSVREHFIAEIESSEYDVESRIELVVALVGPMQDDTDNFLADSTASNTGDAQ